MFSTSSISYWEGYALEGGLFPLPPYIWVYVPKLFAEGSLFGCLRRSQMECFEVSWDWDDIKRLSNFASYVDKHGEFSTIKPIELLVIPSKRIHNIVAKGEYLRVQMNNRLGRTFFDGRKEWATFESKNAMW